MNDNQFALITGTSSGLGLKMAEVLLDLGYNVIGISRTGTPVDHPQFIDILCDVKDEAAVEEMFEIISAHTQSLPLIILNAGVIEMSPLVEMFMKKFLDHMETNVLGAFHVLKHSSGFLIENETHIIAISSISSKKGLANLAAYSASKAALNVLIESLRIEWEHLGVRFSTLLPGPINTTAWSEYDLSYEQFAKMLSIDDFEYVFKMLVKSPKSIEFSEVMFANKKSLDI